MSEERNRRCLLLYQQQTHSVIEIPDLLTWLGMSIILLSGLAVLYLERRENRA